MNNSMRDRAIGALVGLAVGDAVGTTLEFAPRDSYEPLRDMIGGGPFRLAAGQWTDDTSMALCLADSLLEQDGLDPHDLMARFTGWWRNGINSCTGTCFDIGNTVRAALENYERTGEPYSGSDDPYSAGNGSLMRLAPVAIRWCMSAGPAETAARDQSRTTHGAPACLEACAFMTRLMIEAIGGSTKAEILEPRRWPQNPDIDRIAGGSYASRDREDVRGSGYVVDCLEAALWAAHNAGEFREAILLAANLGDDADTTAAIAGQLAGAIWGNTMIPADWRKKLAWSRKIEATADQLYLAGTRERMA